MENGQCLGSDGASCALVDLNRNPLTSEAPLGFSLEICAESCARSTSCNGFELSGCENKCTFVTCGDSITGNSTAGRDTSTQCYTSKAARKSSPRRETVAMSRKPARARPTSDSLPTQAVRGRPVVPLQEKGGLERPRVYRVVICRRVSSACVSHNRRVLDARRGRNVISSAQATGTAPGPTDRRPAATEWTSRGLKFATPAASRARPPMCASDPPVTSSWGLESPRPRLPARRSRLRYLQPPPLGSTLDAIGATSARWRGCGDGVHSIGRRE